MKLQRLSAVLAVVLSLPASWGVAVAPLQRASVPACTTADESCKESLAVGQYSFWYFRSYSLHAPNAAITRAVIVTHGLQRNASDYFAVAVSALHNELDPSLLVIAPHFKGFVRGSSTCSDPLEPGELHWSCVGQESVNRWDDGGQARDTGPDVIYSFSMIDLLLDQLSDRSIFPNLTRITISGHSDGGQFTQRYAAGNQMDGGASPAGSRAPGVRPATPNRLQTRAVSASIQYVIANPGSYMYLDNQRLPQGATCFDDGTCTAEFTASWDPTDQCSDSYNTYKYGLDGRTFGYMASTEPGFSDDELRQRFTSRPVAYLMGEQDQLDTSQLDTSCAANAQGSHLAGDGSGLVGGRRERGTIFWNYMRRLGANHTLSIVPGCGHDPVCMYTSAEMVQALLF